MKFLIQLGFLAAVVITMSIAQLNSTDGDDETLDDAEIEAMFEPVVLNISIPVSSMVITPNNTDLKHVLENAVGKINISHLSPFGKRRRRPKPTTLKPTLLSQEEAVKEQPAIPQAVQSYGDYEAPSQPDDKPSA